MIVAMVYPMDIIISNSNASVVSPIDASLITESPILTSVANSWRDFSLGIFKTFQYTNSHSSEAIVTRTASITQVVVELILLIRCSALCKQYLILQKHGTSHRVFTSDNRRKVNASATTRRSARIIDAVDRSFADS